MKVDDQDRCEWVNVSSGTGSTRYYWRKSHKTVVVVVVIVVVVSTSLSINTVQRKWYWYRTVAWTHVSVCLSVCQSVQSVQWQNGRMDLDAIWGGECGQSRGVLDGVVIVEGNGQFWG